MRVLLAVDRIGALPATDVADALVQGWLTERDDDLVALPLSDGSTGLLGILPDALREVVVVPGPTGQDVPAGIARTGTTWWLDADEVLGAHLVPGRVEDSLQHGSSAGLGVLLAHAVASGAGRVVVGLGAAAVHDAGTGLVRALARAAGHLREEGSADVVTQDEVRAAADLLAGVDIVLARAVDEPLTGLHGTGAQLAERFGVDPVAAQDLDRTTGLRADALLTASADLPTRTVLPLAGSGRSGPQTVDVLDAVGPDRTGVHGHDHSHGQGPDPRGGRLTTRTDGTGAGGGAALALLALGARAFDGGDLVALELGLPAALDALGGAGLVVTSATEVGPDEARRSVMAVVGRHAATRALPVVAVGRSVSASRRELAPGGVSATAALVRGRHPDEEPHADDPVALRDALVDRGARLARTWSRD